MDSCYWQGLILKTWTHGIDRTHSIDLNSWYRILAPESHMSGPSVARTRDYFINTTLLRTNTFTFKAYPVIFRAYPFILKTHLLMPRTNTVLFWTNPVQYIPETCLICVSGTSHIYHKYVLDMLQINTKSVPDMF